MKKKLKRILSITAILLLLAVNLSGFAFADGDHHKVIDGADLLTADEEMLLEERLAEIENEYLLDAVVLTVDDTNGFEIEDFADTYYEETASESVKTVTVRCSSSIWEAAAGISQRWENASVFFQTMHYIR